MALSRTFLKGLGLTDEQVGAIVEANAESLEGIKAERDRYKAEAERLPTVQKELDDLKAAQEKSGKDPYKVKYEAIKEEFDAYKNEQTAKETKAAKTKAFRELLKEAGIAEKRIESVIKVSDVDSIELDSDGKIKGADKLTETVKTEWADFIPSSEPNGAKVTNPPENNGSKMTREQIYAKDDKGRYVMDTASRQKAIAEMLNTKG